MKGVLELMAYRPGIFLILGIAPLAMSHIWAASAEAQLLPPHVLIGTATINGQTAPAGTEIIAWHEAEKLGEATAKAGGAFVLQVSRPRGRVHFKVGGITTEAPFEWKTGTIQRDFVLAAISHLSGQVTPDRFQEATGGRLVSIFYFDNSSKSWAFWDGNIGGTLLVLTPGETYWVRVSKTVSVRANGREQVLSCVDNNCWNQLVW